MKLFINVLGTIVVGAVVFYLIFLLGQNIVYMIQGKEISSDSQYMVVHEERLEFASSGYDHIDTTIVVNKSTRKLYLQLGDASKSEESIGVLWGCFKE